MALNQKEPNIPVTDEKPNSTEEIIYEYMKYNKKKGSKSKKRVTFNQSVELVAFNENWKMTMSEGTLRTEQEQSKRRIERRNY